MFMNINKNVFVFTTIIMI